MGSAVPHVTSRQTLPPFPGRPDYKYHAHVAKFQLVSDLNGDIAWVSGPHYGSTSDSTLWGWYQPAWLQPSDIVLADIVFEDR